MYYVEQNIVIVEKYLKYIGRLKEGNGYFNRAYGYRFF